MSVQQRRHRRVRAEKTAAHLRLGDDVRELGLQVRDISMGGLFVKSAEPLPLGTDLVIELIRPLGVSLVISGRVVSSKRGEGMGLAFHPLSDHTREGLEALLEKEFGITAESAKGDDATPDDPRLAVQIRGLSSELDSVALELNASAEEISLLERQIQALSATLLGLDEAIAAAQEEGK